MGFISQTKQDGIPVVPAPRDVLAVNPYMCTMKRDIAFDYKFDVKEDDFLRPPLDPWAEKRYRPLYDGAMAPPRSGFAPPPYFDRLHRAGSGSSTCERRNNTTTCSCPILQRGRSKSTSGTSESTANCPPAHGRLQFQGDYNSRATTPRVDLKRRSYQYMNGEKPISIDKNGNIKKFPPKNETLTLKRRSTIPGVGTVWANEEVLRRKGSTASQKPVDRRQSFGDIKKSDRRSFKSSSQDLGKKGSFFQSRQSIDYVESGYPAGPKRSRKSIKSSDIQVSKNGSFLSRQSVDYVESGYSAGRKQSRKSIKSLSHDLAKTGSFLKSSRQSVDKPDRPAGRKQSRKSLMSKTESFLKTYRQSVDRVEPASRKQSRKSLKSLSHELTKIGSFLKTSKQSIDAPDRPVSRKQSRKSLSHELSKIGSFLKTSKQSIDVPDHPASRKQSRKSLKSLSQDLPKTGSFIKTDRQSVDIPDYPASSKQSRKSLKSLDFDLPKTGSFLETNRQSVDLPDYPAGRKQSFKSLKSFEIDLAKNVSFGETSMPSVENVHPASRRQSLKSMSHDFAKNVSFLETSRHSVVYDSLGRKQSRGSFKSIEINLKQEDKPEVVVPLKRLSSDVATKPPSGIALGRKEKIVSKNEIITKSTASSSPPFIMESSSSVVKSFKRDERLPKRLSRKSLAIPRESQIVRLPPPSLYGDRGVKSQPKRRSRPGTSEFDQVVKVEQRKRDTGQQLVKSESRRSIPDATALDSLSNRDVGKILVMKEDSVQLPRISEPANLIKSFSLTDINYGRTSAGASSSPGSPDRIFSQVLTARRTTLPAESASPSPDGNSPPPVADVSDECKIFTAGSPQSLHERIYIPSGLSPENPPPQSPSPESPPAAKECTTPKLRSSLASRFSFGPDSPPSPERRRSKPQEVRFVYPTSVDDFGGFNLGRDDSMFCHCSETTSSVSSDSSSYGTLSTLVYSVDGGTSRIDDESANEDNEKHFEPVAILAKSKTGKKMILIDSSIVDTKNLEYDKSERDRDRRKLEKEALKRTDELLLNFWRQGKVQEVIPELEEETSKPGTSGVYKTSRLKRSNEQCVACPALYNASTETIIDKNIPVRNTKAAPVGVRPKKGMPAKSKKDKQSQTTPGPEVVNKKTTTAFTPTDNRSDLVEKSLQISISRLAQIGDVSIACGPADLRKKAKEEKETARHPKNKKGRSRLIDKRDVRSTIKKPHKDPVSIVSARPAKGTNANGRSKKTADSHDKRLTAVTKSPVRLAPIAKPPAVQNKPRESAVAIHGKKTSRASASISADSVEVWSQSLRKSGDRKTSSKPDKAKDVKRRRPSAIESKELSEHESEGGKETSKNRTDKGSSDVRIIHSKSTNYGKEIAMGTKNDKAESSKSMDFKMCDSYVSFEASTNLLAEIKKNRKKHNIKNRSERSLKYEVQTPDSSKSVYFASLDHLTDEWTNKRTKIKEIKEVRPAKKRVRKDKSHEDRRIADQFKPKFKKATNRYCVIDDGSLETSSTGGKFSCELPSISATSCMLESKNAQRSRSPTKGASSSYSITEPKVLKQPKKVTVRKLAKLRLNLIDTILKRQRSNRMFNPNMFYTSKKKLRYINGPVWKKAQPAKPTRKTGTRYRAPPSTDDRRTRRPLKPSRMQSHRPSRQSTKRHSGRGGGASAVGKRSSHLPRPTVADSKSWSSLTKVVGSDTKIQTVKDLNKYLIDRYVKKSRPSSKVSIVISESASSSVSGVKRESKEKSAEDINNTSQHEDSFFRRVSRVLDSVEQSIPEGFENDKTNSLHRVTGSISLHPNSQV